MRNILIVGSGARECIIVQKLVEDSKKLENHLNITCIGTSQNPYISNHCVLYLMEKLDIDKFKEYIAMCKNKFDFAIIGPEGPLFDGFADYLESNNIPCLGPQKKYAQIETSKMYARKFIDYIGLQAHSPKYETVFGEVVTKLNTRDKNLYINNKINNLSKLVLKRDGLCGGKGVIVEDIDFDDREGRDSVINGLLDLKPGEDYVLENKLIGEEFSLMTLTDGNGNIKHFPPIQDYKRLYDNDKGPNTGSMGCISFGNNKLPFLTSDDIQIAENINKSIIENLNLKKENFGYKTGYRGILYGSYIKTSDGQIFIIEFNSRFGDPECILALKKLETNIVTLFTEIADGRLKTPLRFNDNAMIGIYLVPKTYPQPTKEKYDIYINESVKDNIVYGNVERQGGHLFSLSSRSLFYSVSGKNIAQCFKKIYKDVKLITGNFYYRKDIGSKYLSGYEQAGVSIDNGNDAVKNMKTFLENTYNDAVLGKHGDFGGQFRLDSSVLVSSIDGVGTKSILAKKKLGSEAFVNLGKDIVNHCVNDILVQGAYPLFFLDYFGTAHLDLEEVTNFIKGASIACIENGHFPIIGGETAEMPSIYIEDKTDLVGCIIGKKDEKLLCNKTIESGDILMAFSSDSPHTNGYSLINKILDSNWCPDNIVEILLKPHKSYLNEVKEFINAFGYDSIKAMCHITGGGLYENLRRVIPKVYNINIDIGLDFPEWCLYLKEKGNISHSEMMRVFNCGIGFVLIMDSETQKKVRKSDYIKKYKLFNFGIIN